MTELFTLVLIGYNEDTGIAHCYPHRYSFLTRAMAEFVGNRMHDNCSCDTFRIDSNKGTLAHREDARVMGWVNSTDDMPF